MKIDRTLLRRQSMAQSTQNIFWSIGLKDYFDVLEELLDKDSLQTARELTARFSHFNEDYICNFKSNPPKNNTPADITIGDLAYAITEMLDLTGYNGSGDINNSFDSRVYRTGKDLIYNLIILPFMRLAEKKPEHLTSVTKTNDKERMM